MAFNHKVAGSNPARGFSLFLFFFPFCIPRFYLRESRLLSQTSNYTRVDDNLISIKLPLIWWFVVPRDGFGARISRPSRTLLTVSSYVASVDLSHLFKEVKHRSLVFYIARRRGVALRRLVACSGHHIETPMRSRQTVSRSE